MSESQEDKKPGMTLSSQVMAGLLLGLVAGVFFGELIAWLKPVGDIFIKLLQITVIPYISFSLITALGQLSLDEVKRPAIKGGGMLLVAWLITLTLRAPAADLTPVPTSLDPGSCAGRARVDRRPTLPVLPAAQRSFQRRTTTSDGGAVTIAALALPASPRFQPASIDPALT